MLKLISISQLQMGMYIHQFCGSWLDHSFWKAGFVLDSPQDYQRLQHSNLTRLWIDSAKGRDLLEQPPQTSPDSLPPAQGRTPRQPRPGWPWARKSSAPSSSAPIRKKR